MKTKVFLSIALILAFICNSQSVITVDNSVGSNAQFSDLQSAITLANPGDIIYIHPSEINYGSITVNKTLTLIGFGHNDPDKNTFVTNINVSENASNSKFSGLFITSDFIVNNTATVTGIIFENNFVNSDMAFSNGGVDNMIIRGNVIRNIFGNYTNTIITNNIIFSRIWVEFFNSIIIKNNIFFSPNSGSSVPVINNDNASGSVTVQNSIMYFNGSSNMNSTGVIFENCLTYSINGGTPTILSGTNNLDNINPLFVSATDKIFDPDTDDYHLQGGSLAIGNGVAGEDMGIFNAGPFVFNNFGYTNGIPTVKITAITNSVIVGGNIEVTINTNSN